MYTVCIKRLIETPGLNIVSSPRVCKYSAVAKTFVCALHISVQQGYHVLTAPKFKTRVRYSIQLKHEMINAKQALVAQEIFTIARTDSKV